MNFDEIPVRMARLGVNREWLAQQCDYSMSTLANTLAPNGSNKTAKAYRRICEALDREEDRQSKPQQTDSLIYLNFTPEEFTQVDIASRLVNAESIKDYCEEAVKIRTREILDK